MERGVLLPLSGVELHALRCSQRCSSISGLILMCIRVRVSDAAEQATVVRCVLSVWRWRRHPHTHGVLSVSCCTLDLLLLIKGFDCRCCPQHKLVGPAPALARTPRLFTGPVPASAGLPPVGGTYQVYAFGDVSVLQQQAGGGEESVKSENVRNLF